MMSKGFLKAENLAMFCLDEADEILGRGFQEDIDEIYRIVSRDDPDRLTRQLVFEAMTTGRGARAVARVVRNNPKLDALMAPTTLFTAFEAVDVNTHKREETRASSVQHI